MIVETMNTEELAVEILSDYEIVLRKAKYLTKKLRREAIKKRNKHLKRIYEYKSKQNNDWFILIDYNSGDPLALPTVYYLNHGKLNAVVVQAEDEFLVHYSSHFLERYNERFLKKDGLSKLDLLKLFLPDNNIAMYDSIQDSDGYENRVFARFKDGIGLGVLEKFRNKFMVYLRTYISSEMIRESQIQHYKSISDAFKDHWEEFYR